MEQNRGVALILALLVLSFLMVLGGALLATSTIDIWIGDNYKKATQSLYLAEAGIDHGREVLRTSGRTASEWLNWCAGVDGELQTSDDRPLIESVASGAGSYEVWIKNDVADRVAAVDTNEVLILTSISRVGDTRKTIEVAIEKGRFPDNVTDPRLSNIPGLENLAESITRNATDVHAGSTTLADVGGPVDYRVVVVNGNLETGPGTGHGLLLVRGELHVVADTTWNGLIVLIGQGVVRLSPGAAMIVNGALFTARTRAPDGSLLPAPEDVVFNISDTAQMKAANRSFPYNPIAVRER